MHLHSSHYSRPLSINRVLPIICVFVVVFLFLIMQTDSKSDSKRSNHFHFNYTTVPGYFLQSEKDTDSKKFDFKKENFGLIDREYDTDQVDSTEKEQWRRFATYVRHLNSQSEEGVQYKVIFLGRHGQGWHNVAETKYGTAAWDCYWSMLDGAEGITWADANLTAVGQGQALDAHTLWKSLMPHGIPPPDTYYVSPLTRAIETADLTFSGLDLPEEKKYAPIVKELLREAIGVHTCDRRGTASHIEATFPHVKLEPGFAEKDPLWTADYREPRLARRYRLEQLLDDVFAHDAGTFLSFTAHSGAIASMLEAIGHRSFDLETGGVIPVFVKAQVVDGEREQPPHEPSEGPPACTSISPPAALAN